MLEWQEPNSLVGDAEMLLIKCCLSRQEILWGACMTARPRRRQLKRFTHIRSMRDCKAETLPTETFHPCPYAADDCSPIGSSICGEAVVPAKGTLTSLPMASFFSIAGHIG